MTIGHQKVGSNQDFGILNNILIIFFFHDFRKKKETKTEFTQEMHVCYGVHGLF